VIRRAAALAILIALGLVAAPDPTAASRRERFTVSALGVTIPPAILLRANEIVQ
jgi:hypothetical protein